LLTRKLAEDFQREMEGRKGLSHPGLAELIDFGTIGRSALYTVSEFVNGENLSSYLARCPGNKIPLAVSLDLLRQMTEAVAFLHGNNIVHREIHPAGIMLFDDGGRLRTKFTEAGMARFWNENALGATAALSAGESARVLGYSAPEELTQTGEAKPGTDVFSLGCIFYQMLSGRVPYDFRDGDSPARVVEECMIRPIEELVPELPSTVVVILERALAPEAEMRYDSAFELLEALEIVSL
jgi:serine/threonine protein kinase